MKTVLFRCVEYGGFLKWGYPIAGWFIRENPIYKWMMPGGNHQSQFSIEIFHGMSAGKKIFLNI